MNETETLVFTTDGLVPLVELEVHDITEMQANCRVTATEWSRNGKVVRRDVHVNVLRGLSLSADAQL